MVRGAAPYSTPYGVRTSYSPSWCELLMLEVMLVKKHVTRILTSGVDMSVSQDEFLCVYIISARYCNSSGFLKKRLMKNYY